MCDIYALTHLFALILCVSCINFGIEVVYMRPFSHSFSLSRCVIIAHLTSQRWACMFFTRAGLGFKFNHCLLSFYNLGLIESITKFENFSLKICTPHFSKRSGACMFFTQEGHGIKFSHCLSLCNSHGPQIFNLKCSNLVIDSLNPRLFSFMS